MFLNEKFVAIFPLKDQKTCLVVSTTSSYFDPWLYSCTSRVQVNWGSSLSWRKFCRKILVPGLRFIQKIDQTYTHLLVFGVSFIIYLKRIIFHSHYHTDSFLVFVRNHKNVFFIWVEFLRSHFTERQVFLLPRSSHSSSHSNRTAVIPGLSGIYYAVVYILLHFIM